MFINKNDFFRICLGYLGCNLNSISKAISIADGVNCFFFEAARKLFAYIEFKYLEHISLSFLQTMLVFYSHTYICQRYRNNKNLTYSLEILSQNANDAVGLARVTSVPLFCFAKMWICHYITRNLKCIPPFSHICLNVLQYYFCFFNAHFYILKLSTNWL